jgi:hypothetical protein
VRVCRDIGLAQVADSAYGNILSHEHRSEPHPGAPASAVSPPCLELLVATLPATAVRASHVKTAQVQV